MGKQSNKNKKKAWKRVDISDVDQHLEDQRLDQRLGPIDSKISFVIDKETVKEADPCAPVAKAKPKRKRLLKTTKELTSDLKCFKSLKSLSKVPAFKGRPGRKQKPESIKFSANQTSRSGAESESVQDLWADSEAPNERSTLVAEQQKLCGTNAPKVPASVHKKPNLFPAVQIPDPGVSYNPSKADLDLLVTKVVKKEVTKRRKETLIEKSVTKHFQSKSATQIENEYLNEMIQGLGPEASDSEVEQETLVNVKKAPVKASNRKTRAQRNREQRVKETKKQRMAKKEELKKAKQPLGLPKILRQIREQENELQKRQTVRVAKREKLKHEPKRRNRPPMDGEVVPLPSDLKGSLRVVKVEGSLMKERFQNIIARGLVDVGSEKGKKKKKKSLPRTKLYLKRSHRTDVC